MLPLRSRFSKLIVLGDPETANGGYRFFIEKEAELASQHDEIERLKLFIAKLQRMQFGPTSEKLARYIDQLKL